MAESFTMGLGSKEEGVKRREAYEKAWRKAEARSLNDWCKSVLDKAAGFKWESDE